MEASIQSEGHRSLIKLDVQFTNILGLECSIQFNSNITNERGLPAFSYKLAVWNWEFSNWVQILGKKLII